MPGRNSGLVSNGRVPAGTMTAQKWPAWGVGQSVVLASLRYRPAQKNTPANSGGMSCKHVFMGIAPEGIMQTVASLLSPCLQRHAPGSQ